MVAAHHFKENFVRCNISSLDWHGLAEARTAMDLPTDEPTVRRRRGLLIVLSSPSGAGKSTISRMLLKADPEISMSISATTRPMRPGERDNVDYNFVDDAQFDSMIASGEFVEWAHVFGYRYGTPKAPVKSALKDGRDILFDIDWQGSRQLEPDFKEHLVTIFLLPPSMAELERRLQARGTDSAEVIADRMTRAASEISHWAEYEYVLVNDDAERCLDQVRSIVEAERLKRSRHAELDPFVRQLVGPEH
jgi:guanylate kinase